jgi:hypothetical protein
MAAPSDKNSKYKPDLIKVYDQLCQSYRAIDDFRAKLLGFLPLVSGGGIFLLLSAPLPKEYLGPIGAFGAVITLGLFVYEIYGIEKCTALIKAGQDLESSMNSKGQFLRRPTGLLHHPGFLSRISEPFAAGIIYPAVLAAWIYLAFVKTWSLVALVISIVVFVLGFVITYKYTSLLPGVYKLHEEQEKSRKS